jgi:hypothetical protein
VASILELVTSLVRRANQPTCDLYDAPKTPVFLEHDQLPDDANWLSEAVGALPQISTPRLRLTRVGRLAGLDTFGAAYFYARCGALPALYRRG